MFKMYNTDLITNITEEVTEYKRGNWINMIAPSDDEIKTVCENINIQEDFIRYALDPEERARIDYEEDDGTTLILADVPIIEKDEDQKEYSTIPVGFIIVRDEYFITVSLFYYNTNFLINTIPPAIVTKTAKLKVIYNCARPVDIDNNTGASSISSSPAFLLFGVESLSGTCLSL